MIKMKFDSKSCCVKHKCGCNLKKEMKRKN